MKAFGSWGTAASFQLGGVIGCTVGIAGIALGGWVPLVGIGIAIIVAAVAGVAINAFDKTTGSLHKTMSSTGGNLITGAVVAGLVTTVALSGPILGESELTTEAPTASTNEEIVSDEQQENDQLEEIQIDEINKDPQDYINSPEGILDIERNVAYFFIFETIQTIEGSSGSWPICRILTLHPENDFSFHNGCDYLTKKTLGDWGTAHCENDEYNYANDYTTFISPDLRSISIILIQENFEYNTITKIHYDGNLKYIEVDQQTANERCDQIENQ